MSKVVNYDASTYLQNDIQPSPALIGGSGESYSFYKEIGIRNMTGRHLFLITPTERIFLPCIEQCSGELLIKHRQSDFKDTVKHISSDTLFNCSVVKIRSHVVANKAFYYAPLDMYIVPHEFGATFQHDKATELTKEDVIKNAVEKAMYNVCGLGIRVNDIKGKYKRLYFKFNGLDMDPLPIEVTSDAATRSEITISIKDKNNVMKDYILPLSDLEDSKEECIEVFQVLHLGVDKYTVTKTSERISDDREKYTRERHLDVIKEHELVVKDLKKQQDELETKIAKVLGEKSAMIALKKIELEEADIDAKKYINQVSCTKANIGLKSDEISLKSDQLKYQETMWKVGLAVAGTIAGLMLSKVMKKFLTD